MHLAVLDFGIKLDYFKVRKRSEINKNEAVSVGDLLVLNSASHRRL